MPTLAGWRETSPPSACRRRTCAAVAPGPASSARTTPNERSRMTDDQADRADRPGHSDHSEAPSPNLAILETRVYRGANIWSYERAIHLVVDLGSLEDWPSDR